MLRLFVCTTLLLYVGSGFALFNHLLGDDESDSRDGIIIQHSNHISSGTKTAAKVAACKSVGKGICLGVGGVKYVEKQMVESSVANESQSIKNK